MPEEQVLSQIAKDSDSAVAGTPIEISIAGGNSKVYVMPHDFSTGSSGYYGAQDVLINGKLYKAMITLIDRNTLKKKKK